MFELQPLLSAGRAPTGQVVSVALWTGVLALSRHVLRHRWTIVAPPIALWVPYATGSEEALPRQVMGH